jgi:FixJ family two-component response regulator
MPGLNGFELQEKLASKGIRIPVIAISAFDDAETRERAREFEATAFFRKPDDGQALSMRFATPSDSLNKKSLT